LILRSRSRFIVAIAVALSSALLVTSCGTDARPDQGRAVGEAAAPASVVDTTVAPTTSTITTSTTTVEAPPSTTTRSTTGLAAVAGRTIAVDPGHNGRNGAHAAEINRQVDIGTKKKECDTTGTSTNAGYSESAYNLDVSLRLAAILRAAGANVVLTRSDDAGWGPCIDERAAIGNRADADVAISIHADGGPAGGRGFHVNYPVSIKGLTDGIAEESRALAVDVRDAFAAGTGMPYSTYLGSSALLARDDLGGLNLSDVPKVLLETGNMRNATDVGLLTDQAFRERQANAIASGLAAYLASH
jgi:N-acetylmuramoyl-L-alanine amidase